MSEPTVEDRISALERKVVSLQSELAGTESALRELARILLVGGGSTPKYMAWHEGKEQSPPVQAPAQAQPAAPPTSPPASSTTGGNSTGTSLPQSSTQSSAGASASGTGSSSSATTTSAPAVS